MFKLELYLQLDPVQHNVLVEVLEALPPAHNASTGKWAIVEVLYTYQRPWTGGFLPDPTHGKVSLNPILGLGEDKEKWREALVGLMDSVIRNTWGEHKLPDV